MSTELLMCDDMTSCTDLAHHHVVDEIATYFCIVNGYYRDIVSIFLVSAASCKAICEVA